jgi:hypothetical protein
MKVRGIYFVKDGSIWGWGMQQVRSGYVYRDTSFPLKKYQWESQGETRRAETR